MPGNIETHANGVQQNGNAICIPLPATRHPLAVSGDWELITVDTSNPNVDGRGPLVAGQPEVREYPARYKDGDLPVGEWSDVISVTARA